MRCKFSFFFPIPLRGKNLNSSIFVQIVDDEATPYASKYKARTLLDQIIAKLEATHTIAMLEKKKSAIFILFIARNS